jgi:hypothetical protein
MKMYKVKEIQWKQDSIDLEDDEVQAISESEKGACHSWESVQACDDAFTPPFQFLNCWEKHGETVLTQTCQCHTWVKNMNRLQCVSQHFQPCSATKRSWVRRMDLQLSTMPGTSSHRLLNSLLPNTHPSNWHCYWKQYPFAYHLWLVWSHSWQTHKLSQRLPASDS